MLRAGADGRLGIGIFGEGQFLRVGREGEAAAAFERERRNIVGIVGREVAQCAGRRREARKRWLRLSPVKWFQWR